MITKQNITRSTVSPAKREKARTAADTLAIYMEQREELFTRQCLRSDAVGAYALADLYATDACAEGQKLRLHLAAQRHLLGTLPRWRVRYWDMDECAAHARRAEGSA